MLVDPIFAAWVLDVLYPTLVLLSISYPPSHQPLCFPCGCSRAFWEWRRSTCERDPVICSKCSGPNNVLHLHETIMEVGPLEN